MKIFGCYLIMWLIPNLISPFLGEYMSTLINFVLLTAIHVSIPLMTMYLVFRMIYRKEDV